MAKSTFSNISLSCLRPCIILLFTYSWLYVYNYRCMVIARLIAMCAKIANGMESMYCVHPAVRPPKKQHEILFGVYPPLRWRLPIENNACMN